MCQQLRWYIHTNYCFDFALFTSYFFKLLCCYFASLTSSPSIYSFSVIQFNSSSSRSRCSFLTSTSSTSWSYTSTILLTLIIFIFTHSIYSGLRYFLNLLRWHCCPLLSRVDKTCSYSHFIRTHFHIPSCALHLLSTYSCYLTLPFLPTTLFSATIPLHKSLDHWLTDKSITANAQERCRASARDHWLLRRLELTAWGVGTLVPTLARTPCVGTDFSRLHFLRFHESCHRFILFLFVVLSTIINK